MSDGIFQIQKEFAKLNRDDRIEIMDTLLSMFVNGANSSDYRELSARMANDHRQLLAYKMQLVTEFIQVMHKMDVEQRFDLRNEAACKLATKFYEGMS